MEIQSDGPSRTLPINSAEKIDSGTCECSTSDDTIALKEDVKGDLSHELSFLSHVDLQLWFKKNTLF